MTKRELVARIAAETDLHQEQVGTVVQKTLDYIADELAAGRSIEIRNFGIFEVVVRKEHEVTIPERAIVKFRAGKDLKERVESLVK